MKSKSIIKNWHIEDRGEYYALVGSVFEDDRFNNDEIIHTSRLMNIDFEHHKAETRNTIYILS
jgi:hypothetical protein